MMEADKKRLVFVHFQYYAITSFQFRVIQVWNITSTQCLQVLAVGSGQLSGSTQACRARWGDTFFWGDNCCLRCSVCPIIYSLRFQSQFYDVLAIVASLFLAPEMWYWKLTQQNMQTYADVYPDQDEQSNNPSKLWGFFPFYSPIVRPISEQKSKHMTLV